MKNGNVIRLTLMLSLLTLSLMTGCSLFPGAFLDSDRSLAASTGEDPIVREALKVRSSGFNSMDSSLNEEERQMERQRLVRKQEEIHYALASGDLVLGMEARHVVAIWGSPREIQTAGDHQLGNQRWIYHDGISTRLNLGSSRIVYFEEGKVVGWESFP